MAKVTIIDYGIGNLLSVARAFEYCGAEVVVSDNAAQILQAEYLVLPGVGAFADGMGGLRQRRFVESILQYVQGGRPFLGICLGMQLMMESSEEFGVHSGLGIIPGTVKPIPSIDINGVPIKIPHIGWNELVYPQGVSSWEKTILSTVRPGDATYFVHSFACVPKDESTRLANCNYGGHLICAAIKRDNLYGCQFHPEKSGEIGLNVIRGFLR